MRTRELEAHLRRVVKNEVERLYKSKRNYRVSKSYGDIFVERVCKNKTVLAVQDITVMVF